MPGVLGAGDRSGQRETGNGCRERIETTPETGTGNTPTPGADRNDEKTIHAYNMNILIFLQKKKKTLVVWISIQYNKDIHTTEFLKRGCNMNKNRIMEIVHEICTRQSTDCRSLNKRDLAIMLFDEIGIDSKKTNIFEIPLYWDNQTSICFEFNGKDFELTTGLSTIDGETFFIDLRRFSDYGDGEIIPIEYFETKD